MASSVAPREECARAGLVLALRFPTPLITACCFIRTVIGRCIANIYPWRNRVPHRAFERLERYDGKLSRTVLRELRRSNAPWLPDFIGSVRRECLDHMVILNERHLHRVIGEYVAYFNRSRPHQGIGQRIPDPPEDILSADMESPSRIVGYPVLGGLYHDYRRIA
jgi:hypothetical protein